MRIWQDGFEIASNSTQASRRYAFVSGGGSTVAGRTGGLALTSNVGPIRVSPSFGLKSTLVIGFGLRVVGNVTDTLTQGFHFEKGLVEQIHLHFRTETTFFEVDIYRGSTLIASTTEQFSYGNWHFFEFKVAIDPSSGSYELRHNEQTVLSGSGVNTANEGTAGADIWALRWPTNHGDNFQWDDIYINDTSGSVNNDFNGDTFIRGALPNADGTHLDWVTSAGSAHWSLVDDPGTSSPSDTIYVQSDVVGDKDSYHFQDLTGITGTVQAVMLEVQAAMATAGSRTIQPFFRDSGGSEANGANMVVSSVNFAGFVEIFETNPVSASAWSISDLDDGQWGMEVIS